jgi:hypothetical protein
MNEISPISQFLSQKSIALIGFSRNEKSFSRNVYLHLAKSGYEIFPVNPHTESINGNTVYKTVLDIPYKIDAALLLTPKAETLNATKDIVQRGIKNIWIQQFSETPEAIAFCREKDVNLVSGKCLMMYCEPVKNIHGFHRFISKLTGSYRKMK